MLPQGFSAKRGNVQLDALHLAQVGPKATSFSGDGGETLGWYKAQINYRVQRRQQRGKPRLKVAQMVNSRKSKEGGREAR